MKIKTNSKINNSIAINGNDFIKATTNLYTYNDSVIFSQLKYVNVKAYDENNNLLFNLSTTNGNNFCGYFDKYNKKFYMNELYGSFNIYKQYDTNNVSYITIQPLGSSNYYNFSLFY